MEWRAHKVDKLSGLERAAIILRGMGEENLIKFDFNHQNVRFHGDCSRFDYDAVEYNRLTVHHSMENAKLSRGQDSRGAFQFLCPSRIEYLRIITACFAFFSSHLSLFISVRLREKTNSSTKADTFANVIMSSRQLVTGLHHSTNFHLSLFWRMHHRMAVIPLFCVGL